MSQSAYRSSRHRPWYRKITRSHVGTVVGGIALVMLLFTAWQASRANSALRLAASQAQVLQDQIVVGDDNAAKLTLTGLQDSAARAKGSTDGILWDIGSRFPVFGKSISSVQDVSAAIDSIAQNALPSVVNLSSEINLNTYSPHDGKVDIAAIEKIGPSVATASKAFTTANKQIRDIDAGSLLAPLQGPVSAIQAKVGSAEAAAKSANLATRLLPSMLGKDGKRKYLLLIQNNAEIRSTGGIAGSYSILTADNGTLTMGLQGSSRDLIAFKKPVLPMTDDESSVFASTMMTDVRNANLTPDFPRTGEITRAMVKKALDEDVDGVISVDPVAMSYILAGTGPITIAPGAVLTHENAVTTLLNSVYLGVQDADEQDAIFETAARKIFDVVKAGRGESRLAITGMVQAARENRLMVWSSHEDEQRQIASSALSGALSGDDGTTPHVGLYFSDAAAGKMEYYLDYTTRLTAGRCLENNIQELHTFTQVTSNAPAGVATLSQYVSGTDLLTPRGTMRLYLRFFAPHDGGFTDVRVNNKKQTIYADKLLGRNVTRVVLVLRPGESVNVTTTMISGKNQGGDPVFSTTPGVDSSPNDVVTDSACG